MNLFAWMSPQQIYEELTDGPGSAALSDAQEISNEETEREFARAARVQRIGKTIYGGWEGSAADAASGAASPLMRAASEGSQHLHRAQDLLSRQSGSFHDAANSVVPMPEKPPEVGMLDEMLPTESDTEKAVKQYQADAYHNIQVFEGYDNASSYNEDMPRDYTLTNHSGGTFSVTDGGDSGGGAVDGEDSGQPRGPGNYSAPGGGDVGGTPSGSPSPGPAGGGPLPGGESQTNPNEYRPPSAPGHSPGGSPESPAAHQPSTVPPGTVGGHPGGGGSGGGWRGSGAGGPGGAGGSGAGAPGAGRAPGPSAGIGALAAAEEAAARRGAAGPAGARGAFGPMAAPMGAGRGRDEDEEHTRKVLIEADAEGTFGSDVLTAPPVIGDEEDEG